MKHSKSVKFLSIFIVSIYPEQTQSPPIENFLPTVLISIYNINLKLDLQKSTGLLITIEKAWAFERGAKGLFIPHFWKLGLRTKHFWQT